MESAVLDALKVVRDPDLHRDIVSLGFIKDLKVDGGRVASATYGLPRADVPGAWPGAPANAGFQYTLDTTKLSNGSHALVVKATDKTGNVATFATKQVTISN